MDASELFALWVRVQTSFWQKDGLVVVYNIVSLFEKLAKFEDGANRHAHNRDKVQAWEV